MATRSSIKTPQITYAQATTGESFAIRENVAREQAAREEAAINAAKELYRKAAMNAAKVARQKAALASREAIKIARKKAAKASRKAIKDAAARKESADQILVQVELVQEKIVDLQEEPIQGPSDDFENFLVQKLKEIEISILKSNSKKLTYSINGDTFSNSWTISPELKPDRLNVECISFS